VKCVHPLKLELSNNIADHRETYKLLVLLCSLKTSQLKEYIKIESVIQATIQENRIKNSKLSYTPKQLRFSTNCSITFLFSVQCRKHDKSIFSSWFQITAEWSLYM